MLTSGIYGAFRFDGGPVDAYHLRSLGVAPPASPGPAFVLGHDGSQVEAVQRDECDGTITLLVGVLHDPAALIARLGLARDTPPAVLARVALARFGSATPEHLHGEWSLLQWEPHGRLTLMGSIARRDRIYYAVSGGRCFVAPNLFNIGRVPWINAAIDESGFLFAIGRAALRGQGGERTMLHGVAQLAPGASVVVTASGVAHGAAALTPDQPRFTGSFDDAMAQAAALLDTVLASRIGGVPRSALMLSGGLDSSLLACAARAVVGAERLPTLTLVAPPGSGARDEREFAELVARTLDLAITPVHIAGPVNLYRPTEAMLLGQSGPQLVNRPFLVDAVQQAARAAGAALILNGAGGEYNFTGFDPIAPWQQRVRQTVKRMIPGYRDGEAEIGAFHVRLAPHRLAQLPEAIVARLATPVADVHDVGAEDQWGYHPGLLKQLAQTNEFCPGALRMDYPLRDPRLARFFAQLPVRFFRRGRWDRVPVRHYLKGRLPDAIRLRPQGPGLGATDHLLRLKADAPAARARIAAFRRAGIDDWIDLDWLDAALARVGEQGPVDYTDANLVQMTAVNAEMLLWWRTHG